MVTQEALADLFVANRQRLIHFAARIVGSSEAEDVVQTAYVRASARINSYRGDAKLDTWVCAVVKHAALDVLRRRRIYDGLPLTAEPRQLTEPPHIVLHAERREARRRLRRLSPAERSALVASIHYDRNVDGATALGITPQAYKSRRSRARARLEGLNRAA